jgi:hypothetical protein
VNWRILFWVAAAFNLAAGLPLLLTPGFMLQTLEVAPPPDLAFHRMCGLLVVCFGVIYAMIARDLARYRPLVSVAVVGKAGVFAIFAYAWTQGLAPPRALGVALGDLAFGLAFLAFLLTSKPARA